MKYLLLILPILLVNYVNAEECTTPNGEKAECISLYGCPVLLKALGTNQEAVSQFVRNSTCGGDATNPMVCCGSVSTFNNSTKIEDEQQPVTKKKVKSLLPDKTICGFQHSDDYLRANNNTVLSESPWLTRVYVYFDPINRLFGRIDFCSGALINTRYVLTAASCIFSEHDTAIGVRLGDFDLLSKTDCQHDGRYYECSDVQKADAEEVIIHPSWRKNFDGYDIALLRLNKTVRYSDYIRPICLPERSRIQTGTITTTGFDATKYNKYRNLYEVITAEECKKTFHWSVGEVEARDIEENQFCILLKINETNTECGLGGGFGGIPAMYTKRHQWFQAGIITGTGNPCEIGPRICTNVTYHLDWIKDSLKP